MSRHSLKVALSGGIVSAQLIDFIHQKRIRMALKRAQEVLWDWPPEGGGPSDDETVAALWLIFADADLIAAAETSPDRLGTAVRDIRSILRRKGPGSFVTSRYIINALWVESALDAAWLYKALGVAKDRLTFIRGRPKRGHDEAS